MKKYMCLISAVACVVGVSVALAVATVPANPSAKPAAAQPAKKAPSFLFVIHAKTGIIKKDKDGSTVLEMDKTDINHVIAFSDRPNRIVKMITGKDLQGLWKEGSNSFEKDPPNAVLTGANRTPDIVILKGIKVDQHKVSFPIQFSGAGMHELSARGTRLIRPALVIDDCPYGPLRETGNVDVNQDISAPEDSMNDSMYRIRGVCV